MDPTLTRSQAHQVFGDLYRKPRSPELQQEVDKIVSSTSDVFVRIKRIEELDSSSRGGGSGVETSDPDTPSRRRENRQRGGGSSGSSAASAPARRASSPKRSLTSEVGFFTRLFGGQLAVWGKETGTLAVGLFGLNINISKRSVELFNSIREEQIVSALKVFRALMQFGWEKWEPARYNVVMTSYQFFTEFIKMPSLFRKREDPATWAQESVRLQKYYAALLGYSDFKRILTEDAVKLAGKSDELTAQLGDFRAVVNFICSLETRRPTLTNAIIAFYALQTRKIYSWDDVVKQVGGMDPVSDRYKAPDSILGLINGRAKKIKESISVKHGEIKEIEEIQKRFFTFDDNGKVKVDFLNEIFEDVIRRSLSDKSATESIVKSHRSQPHRLLFYILRDFDISVSPLLSGSVSLKSGGASEDSLIFKQGLFRTPLEELGTLLREIDGFNKKNNNFEYSFKEFKEDLSRGTHDPVHVLFLQMVKRANKIFHLIVFDLKTVIDNHDMAMATERSGKNMEKLSRSRSISIESFEIGMRYLPHYDRVILSNTRMNGRTVEDAVRSTVRNLYNYLYIYRDPELIKTLSSIARIHSEISTMKSELARMGLEES